jgi:hypothetical protein
MEALTSRQPLRSYHPSVARVATVAELRAAAGLTKESNTLQGRVADYLKASPELAHWLSRWQADDAT